jgi:hypothetical protein
MTGCGGSSDGFTPIRGAIVMHRLVDWFLQSAQRNRRPHSRRLTNRTILGLTRLEGRETPAAGFTASSVAAGGAPVVSVLRPDGSELTRITAYDAAFRGGVSAAVGEMDGNPGTVEVVTGAGAGGGPHVRVFSVDTASGAVTDLAGFMAYAPAFVGGVSVAAGDFDGDGRDELVTGAGAGGGPHVRTFTVANGAATQMTGALGDLMAFDTAFSGGVRVAAGDLDGTPGDELVLAAGPGGGPHVRVLRNDGSEFAGFMTFDPRFTGGVSLGEFGTNQLTVNSLSGGGVTRFDFGADGVVTPTILTPLPPLAVTTNPPLGGTGLTPGATTLAGTPLTPGTFGGTVTNPFGDPLFTPPVIGASSPGTTLGPGSLATNFGNLTPLQVAAANGQQLPGVNPLTTNPLFNGLDFTP